MDIGNHPIEKRKHVRLAIRLPYRLTVKGTNHSGFTGNISLGGVYLETFDTPIPPDALGERGQIAITSDDAELVNTGCRVVYIGGGAIPHPEGVGIAFEGTEDTALSKLRAFLVASVAG